MARYKVHGSWTLDSTFGPFDVQSADVLDTRTGDVFREGAFRVTLDGTPAKRGKGGTVPFFGETAWCYAERLASDLALADRYGHGS